MIFLWSDGAVTEDINNLIEGTYFITVKDAHQCELISSFAVNQPDEIELALTSVSTNCFSSMDGSIDLSISGGTEPYTYLWSDGSISEDLLLVVGGNYSVLVTDANNCTQTASSIIESPDSLIAAVNVVHLGGIAPYYYEWSNGMITEDLTNITGGFYTVTVTDASGCIAILTVQVYETIASSLVDSDSDLNIHVLNTGSGNYLLTFTPNVNDIFTISLFDDAGRKIRNIFSGNLKANESRDVSVECGTLSGGIYLLKVFSKSSAQTLKLFLSK
ncbi:MAG: hypothetical protein IPP71_23015 [Bacteroidetes bacterium]|nr:hypothetical protein [Bacteroidota bacterium]